MHPYRAVAKAACLHDLLAEEVLRHTRAFRRRQAMARRRPNPLPCLPAGRHQGRGGLDRVNVYFSVSWMNELTGCLIRCKFFVINAFWTSSLSAPKK